MLVSAAVTAADPHQAIEAVFRIEQARLIAGLARMVRDVGLAEEPAQGAPVAAREQGPQPGIPGKPASPQGSLPRHPRCRLAPRLRLHGAAIEEIARDDV